MNASPFVELVDVTKSFGDVRLYDGLSLSVARGETLTVVGASGSGKSVLLKMILGLVAPDRGKVRFVGEEISGRSDEEMVALRRRMAMLFQSGALFDSLTVGENVGYPLRERGRPDDEIAAAVARTLALVGLAGIEARDPAELSGGMRKRVALARAIVAQPELVLFDEPTTGLDPIATRRILELIRSIQARLRNTSIVVTHDLAAAYFISDRIAMLSGGRILDVLAPAEFRRAPAPAIHEFVTAMEGAR